MTTRHRNRRQPTTFRRKSDAPGLVRLNVPLSIKADGIDTSARTFEGLAATWDQDLGQDIIRKGAFKKTIAEWKASGEAMPLLNSHDHYDIFAALGQAIAMKETPDGLWTKWEVLPGDDGDKVLQRLRPSPTTGRSIIGKMSIGFSPTKFSYEQPDGTESFFDRIRIIEEADLKEVSLVLFPMNPGASIDASTVKMWLKMAHEQDPKCLDSLTRLELRRLNSKIGLLLKKQQPTDDIDGDPDDDEQESPSSRSTSARSVQRKVTEDDETDELEDTDEEETLDDSEETDADDQSDTADDSVDDASTDTTADESADSASTQSTGTQTKGSSQGTTADEGSPPVYAFGEALQHRLKQVTFRHKASDLKNRMP